MGFDETLSMTAAQKYGKNIDGAISFITAQPSKSVSNSILNETTSTAATSIPKPHSEAEKKCNNDPSNTDSISTTDYLQRIDHVLKLNENIDQNQHDIDQQDIGDSVNKYYEAKGGIQRFYCDYYDFVDHMDDEDQKESVVDTERIDQPPTRCDLKACRSITRNWRDRSIYDCNNKRRFELYDRCSSEESVMVQQTLDKIHICKHHMIDLGFRINHHELNHIDEDRFKLIRDKIKNQRDVLKNIRGDIDIDNIKDNKFGVSSASKFMTHMMEDDDEKDGIDDSKSFPEYSSGIRYFYHDYYKDNQTTEEIIPGTKRTLERGNAMINASYGIGTWYIAPKYDSLKQEIIEGAASKLSIIQYDNTLKAVAVKFDSFGKNIRKARFHWQKVYGIKEDSTITLQHVLAVTLYTDFTDLSCEFTSSYRRSSKTETDVSLKQRHQSFANWGRLIREAVEVWGTVLEEAPEYEVFYHGITRRI